MAWDRKCKCYINSPTHTNYKRFCILFITIFKIIHLNYIFILFWFKQWVHVRISKIAHVTGTCDWHWITLIIFFIFQENDTAGDDAISIEELPVCTFFTFLYCIYIFLLLFWLLPSGFLKSCQHSLKLMILYSFLFFFYCTHVVYTINFYVLYNERFVLGIYSYHNCMYRYIFSGMYSTWNKLDF